MRRNGQNDDSARGKRNTQTGCKFSRTDAATLTLTPNGIDSKATVIVRSGTQLNTVILTAALTCALTTSGAGGLDTGSEADNKGYYVFLITQPNGKVPKLLCSLSATNPTMPSGYPFRSDPIWFISNNGDGDIRPFIDVNGTCFYNATGDTAALSIGLAYSGWAAIDLSVIAPVNSIGHFYGYCRSKQNSGTWNNVRFHTNDDDATDSTFWNVLFTFVIRSANASPGQHQSMTWPIGSNAAESMYYKWTNNPGSDAGSYPPRMMLWCRGWRLK